MNKVLLKNDLGESVIANVLRYFKFNDNQYMVYSLNEVDESDYMKLYGVKIDLDQNGGVVATAIDDSIWTGVVSLIKDIVKAKTQGERIDINDLNLDSIDSINLVSKRVFKINKDMANLLPEENQQWQGDTQQVNDTAVSTDEIQTDNKFTNEMDANPMSVVQPFEMPNLNSEGISENIESSTQNITDYNNQVSYENNNENQNQNQNNTNGYNYKELYDQVLEENKKLMDENNSLRNKITNIESILKD